MELKLFKPKMKCGFVCIVGFIGTRDHYLENFQIKIEFRKYKLLVFNENYSLFYIQTPCLMNFY